jgi:phage shock protein A
MDLNDMLKEHQLWLDKARQALTSAKAGDHLPADLRQPRIEQIKARIAELKAQKEREIRRYEAAIAELNDVLAGLTAKPPPDPGDSPPAATAKKKPAKEAGK